MCSKQYQSKTHSFDGSDTWIEWLPTDFPEMPLKSGMEGKGPKEEKEKPGVRGKGPEEDKGQPGRTTSSPHSMTQ